MKSFLVLRRIGVAIELFIPDKYTGSYTVNLKDAKRFATITDALGFLTNPDTYEKYIGVNTIIPDRFVIQRVEEVTDPKLVLKEIL